MSLFFKQLSLFIPLFAIVSVGLSQSTNTQSYSANSGNPISFSDPGGSGVNTPYGSNQHYVYVLCPEYAQQYASINLSNIQLGIGDNIVVINGSTSQAPFINMISGSAPNMTITSSSSDHCLTLIFSSDANNNGNGWDAVISSSAAKGLNTNICQETDCIGGCARTICGSGLYEWQNTGTNIQDLNNLNSGCLTNFSTLGLENNNVWFYLNPKTAGTLEVLIESGAGGQIYDYAIWKSYNETVLCPAISGNDPVSCEAENNGQNNTTPQGSGFSNAAWVNPSSNPTNKKYYEFAGYEPAIIITQAEIDAGIIFMLLINVRSNGSPQPVVDIKIGGTAMLDCTPLAVELVDFFGIQQGAVNELQWTTQTEQDNSHFIVERSINSMDWEYLGMVDGAGNSTEALSYRLEDANPYFPLTYYRLKQIDIDGEATQYKTISLVRTVVSDEWISSVYPNPASTYVNLIHNNPDTENPLIIELYNAVGQRVLLQNEKIEDKNQAFTLDLQTLSNGMYTLKCVQGEKVKVEKLIVLGK